MPRSTQTSSLFPKRGGHNAKRNDETRGQRLCNYMVFVVKGRRKHFLIAYGLVIAFLLYVSSCLSWWSPHEAKRELISVLTSRGEEGAGHCDDLTKRRELVSVRTSRGGDGAGLNDDLTRRRGSLSLWWPHEAKRGLVSVMTSRGEEELVSVMTSRGEEGASLCDALTMRRGN